MRTVKQTARPVRGVARFDLRYVIAGLFALYGLLLVGYGLWGVTAIDRERTGGLAIDLWAGLGLVAVAVAFGAWAWFRPQQEPPETETETDPGVGACDESARRSFSDSF